MGDLDIKIKIAYCGICHTDLHQMRNDWKNSTYPMVPGCALFSLQPYVSCMSTHNCSHAEPFYLKPWQCLTHSQWCPACVLLNFRCTQHAVMDM